MKPVKAVAIDIDDGRLELFPRGYPTAEALDDKCVLTDVIIRDEADDLARTNAIKTLEFVMCKCADWSGNDISALIESYPELADALVVVKKAQMEGKAL